MQIFNQDWSNAYQEAINHNSAYTETSQKWNHGSLAMAIHFDDATAQAVCLDLEAGHCNDAQSMSLETAHEQANFVIEGDTVAWKAVLNNDIQPLMAIMRGKLKLTKGSISKLMPFAKSASELVNSAQILDTEFPE